MPGKGAKELEVICTFFNFSFERKPFRSRTPPGKPDKTPQKKGSILRRYVSGPDLLSPRNLGKILSPSSHNFASFSTWFEFTTIQYRHHPRCVGWWDGRLVGSDERWTWCLIEAWKCRLCFFFNSSVPRWVFVCNNFVGCLSLEMWCDFSFYEYNVYMSTIVY